MSRKSLSWLLMCSLGLMLAFPEPAVAKSRAEKDSERTERVRTIILGLGVGDLARVVVKLRDGRKVGGYVKEAGQDSFVIADLSTGAIIAVPYPTVTQVQGHHLSKGAKIAIIGLSIAVGVLAFFLWLENAD